LFIHALGTSLYLFHWDLSLGQLLARFSTMFCLAYLQALFLAFCSVAYLRCAPTKTGTLGSW